MFLQEATPGRVLINCELQSCASAEFQRKPISPVFWGASYAQRIQILRTCWEMITTNRSKKYFPFNRNFESQYLSNRFDRFLNKLILFSRKWLKILLIHRQFLIKLLLRSLLKSKHMNQFMRGEKIQIQVWIFDKYILFVDEILIISLHLG
jgi:hypothetical protein